jgi:hypothetical protein
MHNYNAGFVSVVANLSSTQEVTHEIVELLTGPGFFITMFAMAIYLGIKHNVGSRVGRALSAFLGKAGEVRSFYNYLHSGCYCFLCAPDRRDFAFYEPSIAGVWPANDTCLVFYQVGKMEEIDAYDPERD